MVSFFGELDGRRIFRGRLALALTGLRAEKCRNRRCARARHCLGMFATNIHAPAGTCPIMTLAEWRAVGFAMSLIAERLRPWFKAQDAKEDALIAQIPKAERARVIEQLEAEERERAKTRRKWKPYYWDILWLEPVEDELKTAADIVAEEKKLIAEATARGCRCAREGMRMDCDGCG